MRKTTFIIALLMVAALLVPVSLGDRTLITTANMTYATPYVGDGSRWKAIDATNDMYVWSPGPSGKQIFIINTTETGNALPQAFSISAGFGLGADLGAYSKNLATNKTWILGPFETARFKQTNGQIYLNFNKTQGSIFCVNLP